MAAVFRLCFLAMGPEDTYEMSKINSELEKITE
jgi:hypothetical protein